MNKPQPISKVVVTLSRGGSRTLSVLVATPDADRWVRDNLEEFGELFFPERRANTRDFILFVARNYDVDEVAAYIRTMGSDEDTDDSLGAFDTPSTEGATDKEE